MEPPPAPCRVAPVASGEPSPRQSGVLLPANGLEPFPVVSGPRAKSRRGYLKRRDGEENLRYDGYGSQRGQLSGPERRSGDGRGVQLEAPSSNNLILRLEKNHDNSRNKENQKYNKKSPK